MRKTIGETLRLNMDHLLLSQHFRDEDRLFKKELFRQHVNPLLDQIDQDDTVDTSMYTPDQLFALAVSVAKKRSHYSPRTKKKAVPAKKKGFPRSNSERFVQP